MPIDRVTLQPPGESPAAVFYDEHTSMRYDESKTRQYLDFLFEHVIEPVRKEVVSESCFATALLVFAAVDGLGRLVIESGKDAISPGKRFKHFLVRLGADYAAHSDALWTLRNSLVHNALNTASHMSKLSSTRDKHLADFGSSLLVNTIVLTDDLVAAMNALDSEFRTNADLLARAESRLCTYIDPLAASSNAMIDNKCFTRPPEFLMRDIAANDSTEDGEGF